MPEHYGKITEFKNIDSKTANQQGFFFRINGQNCKIMTYKGNEEQVIIPDAINGKPVRAIGKRAFANKNITSVVLPYSLKRIGEEAFYQCKLKSLELPETIEKIEENAFGECEELTTVMLKGERKSFDVTWHAFAKTPYIDKTPIVVLGNMLIRVNYANEGTGILKIPDGIRVVTKDAADNGCFRYDADYLIYRLEIPASVRRIEDRAFRRLHRLAEVEVEKKPGHHFLWLEKEVFGSSIFFGGFLSKIKEKELGEMSFYSTGNIKFKNLALVHNVGYSLCSSSNECTLYIPPNPDAKDEFWDSIQLKYASHKQFYFMLDLQDYYNLMMKIKSLREQLKMATVLVWHSHGILRERIILFFQQHINKAVEMAVKENDIEQLKLYANLHLIDEEKGFCIRHGKYLAEKYQNGAVEYLKKWI